MNDLATLPLTEERAAEILVQARGDLFVASQLLGLTSVKLDRMIRSSEPLQRTWLALRQVKALDEYDKLSQEQIEREVNVRLTHYRSDALEALHELATMDHGENAGLAQVRLLAASRLSGPPRLNRTIASFTARSAPVSPIHAHDRSALWAKSRGRD